MTVDKSGTFSEVDLQSKKAMEGQLHPGASDTSAASEIKSGLRNEGLPSTSVKQEVFSEESKS